nr:hypothetical protein [Nitrosomonas aestuarii]
MQNLPWLRGEPGRQLHPQRSFCHSPLFYGNDTQQGQQKRNNPLPAGLAFFAVFAARFVCALAGLARQTAFLQIHLPGYRQIYSSNIPDALQNSPWRDATASETSYRGQGV